MIKSITIDSTFFEKEVNKFLFTHGINKSDVISITTSVGMTTLWYWK